MYDFGFYLGTRATAQVAAEPGTVLQDSGGLGVEDIFLDTRDYISGD